MLKVYRKCRLCILMKTITFVIGPYHISCYRFVSKDAFSHCLCSTVSNTKRVNCIFQTP